MIATNNYIESKKDMSQVINILTGETKKMRCHYLSKRTDKPVSRVLTLERLNHPALTAAGVTAWAERFNDGVNRFDWLRVSIQLTDKICYTPNCANHDLPSIEHYNDYNDVNRRNVDNFFKSIADKPAKMMTGEDWPNMAVIAAYKTAGRDQEAETLTAARDTYNARREADKEAWRKKYAAQQYYYNSPKPKNFADLTEIEKAQCMMETVQECAKDHPELEWADILERAEKRFEKAKKEAEKTFRETLTIKVGDRVTSKHYHQTGTVTNIRQEKGEMVYDVKFDKPVKSFWTEQEMKETTFGRYAITKNYDPATGCEIEGTAIYYAEELQADFWLSNSRTIFGMEIFKPTDRRPSWLVVADIFSDPKEMTLREVCDMLAARYQEEHKVA